MTPAPGYTLGFDGDSVTVGLAGTHGAVTVMLAEPVPVDVPLVAVAFAEYVPGVVPAGTVFVIVDEPAAAGDSVNDP